MRISFLSKERRMQNAQRFKKLNAALLFIFPAFLVLIAEYNQLQSYTALRDFFLQKPGVFLFDCFFVGTLYGVILFAVRKAYVAALASGLFFFILSCVEFFKYDISGSHFIPQDLALTGKFNTVASMARLRLTLPILVAFLLLAGFVFLLFVTGAHVKARGTSRFFWGGTCLTLAVLTVASPLAVTVQAAFDVDTSAAPHKFLAASKFENNNMVAFWASELSRALTLEQQAPEGYGKDLVESHLPVLSGGKTPKTLPNVVVVMSESFADFRLLGEAAVPAGTYDAFDAAKNQGFSGTAIVPTFGGYTIRSEFELLLGLPVASLGDPVFPHKEITRAETGAFPALFQAQGYTTAYIHPFAADFYDRDMLYPSLGFDTLLFEEDLPVAENTFRAYADDGLLFDSVLSVLAESQEQAFVFATTMQNHQPFYEDGSEQATAESEFAYYMEGLAHSDRQLAAFLENLAALDEPTILLFIGDHYPFFGQPGNLYEAFDQDDADWAVLFEQPYFVWANYEADFSGFSAAAKTPLSLFYLPHLLFQTAIPQGKDRFSAAVLSYLKETPVYTTPYQPDHPAHAGLDLLTFDRLNGEGFSIAPK